MEFPERDEKERTAEELKRVQTWGKLRPEGDVLGMWLAGGLTGRIFRHLVDHDGNHVPEGSVKVPGSYGIAYESKSMPECFGMGAGCVYEVAFHWDQWVVCTIKCDHGTFEESSDYFNVTEALMRAMVAFNQADHPEAEQEK